MEDYASAAARHWDNAIYLAQDNRWQEAAYVAGYVAECAFKLSGGGHAPGPRQAACGSSAYYHEGEDMPDLLAEDAPYGIPIPYTVELLNLSDLTGVTSLLTAPQGAYERLVRLIGAYLARETV